MSIFFKETKVSIFLIYLFFSFEIILLENKKTKQNMLIESPEGQMKRKKYDIGHSFFSICSVNKGNVQSFDTQIFLFKLLPLLVHGKEKLYLSLFLFFT